MVQRDELDYLIKEHMVKTSTGVCSFKFPKGREWKVNIIFHSSHKGRNEKDQNKRSTTTGTYINITHHGHKLPIGSRRWFDKYEDAAMAARIWNMALKDSNTRWDISAEVTHCTEQRAWEKEHKNS